MTDATVLRSVSVVAEQALARTPARLLEGRAGTAYRTRTLLQLRADHAAARDAVQADFDMLGVFGSDRVEAYGLFTVETQAQSRAEFLTRPDRGRRLDEKSRSRLIEDCPREADIQVVIGDGLSARAMAIQAPALLDALAAACRARNWRFGRPFLVRHCRVGILNDVGDLLAPTIVVLLIGERPGLATADSLSAYIAYRPRAGHTDANRNLISNIHERGVIIADAACRIIALANQMRALGRSGIEIKEERPALGPAA